VEHDGDRGFSVVAGTDDEETVFDRLACRVQAEIGRLWDVLRMAHHYACKDPQAAPKAL